jgi:lectin-like protein
MKRSITQSSILVISLFLFTHAVNAQPTPTPTPVLPEGYDWKYNPDNGHYYSIVLNQMSWPEAKIFAEEISCHLVTITNYEEEKFILQYFSQGQYKSTKWIGLFKKLNEWYWVTGEPFTYINFAEGEPSGDGDYVVISWGSNEEWNDYSNNDKHYFIIECDSHLPYITPTPTTTPTPTPTPETWSSLNGETLEDNYLTAGAPAGYTQGRIKLGKIPEGEGSDGIGMEIKLAPGQGVFISSFKEFAMPSLVHLSGSFRADNKDVAIALVGLNSPIDGQIGYTNVRGEEIPVDDYRKFNLIFAPPSGNVQYAIQAVNSPFSTISSTVWVDNIEVKPYEPIVDVEPVELEVNGNFEGGLESLMVNINGDDGTVIPFFETITDIALRMSIEPSNIAANIGTTCQGIYDQFPFSLLGQVSVKRESMPGGGMMALVITNGFQNLGIFRYADQIKTINDVQDEMLIIGGDFTANNPDIPISAFVQLGGPGADVSVVVDDLVIMK